MYKTILAAIELTEDAASRVLRRAATLLAPGGKLIVAHVVEPQYVQYSFDPTFTGSLNHELEAQAIATATGRLAELCAAFSRAEKVSVDAQIIVLGRAADRIHDLARDHSAEVIVVGAHNQQGWHRLLGSTANAVLHGAPVNVLVTRLPG